MNNLELCLAVAKSQGLKCYIAKLGEREYVRITRGNTIIPTVYNPLFDGGQLVELMLKCEVDVCHCSGHVSIASEYTDRPPQATAYFGDAEGFPRAVLECVLEVARLKAKALSHKQFLPPISAGSVDTAGAFTPTES